MSPRRRRGSSLLEALVSASVLLILLGMMAPLFGRTSRLVQRSDRDASAQQQALRSVQELFAEAAYSSGRTLCLNSGDTTCAAFLSLRPMQRPGLRTLNADEFQSLGLAPASLDWRKTTLVYYQSSERRLLTKEFRYADSSHELVRVRPEKLQQLIYSPDSPPMELANGVMSFQVTSPREGALRVKVATEKSWDKTFRSELDLMVAMRNP